MGEQVFIVLLDEHVADIKLEPVFFAQVHQTPLALAGYVQDAVNVHWHVGDDMQVQQWLLAIQGELAVKVGVSLLGDLPLRLAPDRRTLVNHRVLQVNWEGDEVGVPLDDLPETPF